MATTTVWDSIGTAGQAGRAAPTKRCDTMEASEPPATTRTPDPTEPLLRMLNGHCLQQALHVAAVLGIADRLASGPRLVEELAVSTGTDPLSLLRLLRALASVDVFEETTDGAFALTVLGAHLCADTPGSVRDRALYYGSPAMWGVWARCCTASAPARRPVRTSTAHPSTSTCCATPEAGGPFNRYMGSTSERHTGRCCEPTTSAGSRR